jgi:fructosamine-3-kinase
MSDAVRAGLAALLGATVSSKPPQRVGGGSIYACFRYEIGTEPVFVKIAPAASIELLTAEAVGLEELRTAAAIRVPNVRSVGVSEGHALLVLEWIDIAGNNAADSKLGELLAIQHRSVKPLFGWQRHNFIGSTPQINFWSRNWINFWREHRLEAQLNRVEEAGADDRIIERTALLSTLIDGFFVSYMPIASLLHGDLWSGNRATDTRGSPVIFDPAVYYGDRECDLAMTRLFGGFSSEFHAAYAATWPLDVGWQQRVELYNLYHVLNHFNLFGGGYLSQAGEMVERLLAELGH